MLRLLPILIVLLLASAANAQCSGGSCGIRQGRASRPAARVVRGGGGRVLAVLGKVRPRNWGR